MKIGEVGLVVAPVQPVDGVNRGIEARQEATDRRQVLSAVEELGLPELSMPNRGVNIAYDRDTRQNIVQIVDKDSGEVLQQIPGKDVVERAKYYRELSGL